MDASNEHSQSQPVYNWHASYPVPTASGSQSPMYIPSHPQISQSASRIGHPHGQPMPAQQSYSHSIRQDYTNPSSHPQAPSSNVMPTPPFYHAHHQQQQHPHLQQQISGYYHSTAAMVQHHLANAAAQDPQAAGYDETTLHFIDYSQQRSYSSRSTLVTNSQIVMRRRRAAPSSPYPHGPQEVQKVREQRKQNGLSVWPNHRSAYTTPTPPKEELMLQEDTAGLAESSTTTTATSASQAISMCDPSNMEARLPRTTPATILPAGSETPQTLVWTANNEEQQHLQQPKPEPYSLDEDSSSASTQTPPMITPPGGIAVTSAMPTATQPHTTNTVFIHSNVPRASTTAGDGNEDYEEYRNFFPNDTNEHRELRIAMHDVMTSEWKTRNELEPTSRDLLQFSVKVVGPEGGMTFRCLLYHNGEPCDSTWSRAERMLAHLRKAIDLRPFACEGDGETTCNCGQRFFAEDTLQQHRKNIHTVKCEYCDSSVTPRNKKRHLRNNCAKSPFRV